ncbi:MAG: FeoA family protein [Oceanidesulfovibrio sp.]
MFRYFLADAPDSEGEAPAHASRKRFRRRRTRGCGHPCCQRSQGSQRADAAPLTAFRAGDTIVVDRIERGPLACRLYAMGLTPGTPVTIESPGPGSARFIVRGSSIILGHKEAERILCVLPETVANSHDSLEATDEAPLTRNLPPPRLD